MKPTFFSGCAGKPYQPSNGTEGATFLDAWCCRCARDKSLREGAPIEECDDDEKCEIVTRSMAFSVGDAEYPVEWVYGADGQPKCTAFVQAGDPLPTPRCTRTQDMLGESE